MLSNLSPVYQHVVIAQACYRCQGVLSRTLTSCCVRYYTRMDAENGMRFINGTRLDDRIIRTDWDAGFKEGRQYGRGKSGGQVRIRSLLCSGRATVERLICLHLHLSLFLRGMFHHVPTEVCRTLISYDSEERICFFSSIFSF